ncbi:MAG TPA: hypothetical protein VF006_25235 [Longimicrobium sp.]
MRTIFVFSMFLALGGCHDLATASRISTRPQPDDSHSDLAGLSDYWLRLSPEARRAGLEVIREIAVEQGVVAVPPQIALADAELPGGVAALVIRDPQAPEQHLLVLSPTGSLEEALVTGLVIFTQSHSGVGGAPPNLAYRPRVVTDAPAAELARRFAAARERSVGGMLSERLLRDAISVAVVEVPGVGLATLLHFD